MSRLQEDYNQRLINRDQDIKVLDPKEAYTAHARGINERGELVVETSDGEIREIFSGEVSVRGVYGYV